MIRKEYRDSFIEFAEKQFTHLNSGQKKKLRRIYGHTDFELYSIDQLENAVRLMHTSLQQNLDEKMLKYVQSNHQLLNCHA